MELWINKSFSINTVHMWHHKNGSNLATSKKFEAEQWQTSAVSAQKGVPQQSSKMTWFWHMLTAKGWTRALSERFLMKRLPFALATSARRKNRSFSLWVHYLKNRSDRAHRVVHSSLCCMFHTSLCTIHSKKFRGDFHFLVISYMLCMEMTSSCSSYRWFSWG